jgi:FlaA1/EpsC-like NDP-sugar epimerase
MVLWALARAEGGEIFVPKIASYRITDVARAVGPDCEQRVVGIRPGEKLHEEMITASDSPSTVDLGAYYAILPTSGAYTVDEYCARHQAARVPAGFYYSSDINPVFLSVAELRALIERHVDPRG